MKNLLRNVAYASVIIAALTVTLHQFNRPAEAQIGGQSIAAVTPGNVFTAVTTGGDVYAVELARNGLPFMTTFSGNIFGETAIPVRPTTLGAIKARNSK